MRRDDENQQKSGENTVTSKSYVDAQDALKQNKIPATGTNASTPSDTVVTYTGTAGTIGERGIFDMDTGWDAQNQEIVSGHKGDLVPAESMLQAMEASISNQIQSALDYREPVRVVKTLCANSPTCTLWEMQDVIVEQLECETASDCGSMYCLQGKIKGCVGGACRCVAE